MQYGKQQMTGTANRSQQKHGELFYLALVMGVLILYTGLKLVIQAWLDILFPNQYFYEKVIAYFVLFLPFGNVCVRLSLKNAEARKWKAAQTKQTGTGNQTH
jgi:cytochrome c biogenesis protein CcdA